MSHLILPPLFWLATMPTLADQASVIIGGRGCPIIIDSDAPAKGPLVDGGCELRPGACCPGVNLDGAGLRDVSPRQAELQRPDAAGAD